MSRQLFRLNRLCAQCLAALLALVLCGSVLALDKNALLFSAVNSKYGLSADFFGQWVGPDGDEKSQYRIGHVQLRQLGASAGIEYRLAESEGAHGPQGFFREVWSPDAEYIALPLGRFEGFWICTAKQLLAQSIKPPPSDAIMVRYGLQNASVWHSFTGWTGDHVLRFEANIENSKIPFSYDLKQMRISSPVAPISVLDAVHPGSALEIAWGR